MTVLAFVIGIVVLVVGLAVSIALHELGHLIPAKRFGVRVGQYMIGFGPTLWSKRIGETEYGAKAFPIGGYISMAGMYPPSPREAERPGRAGGGLFAAMVQDARSANDETLEGDGDTRVFFRLPVWKRVVVMLGGPVMNLLFAIVLFTVVLAGFGVQTATSTVNAVVPCVGSAGTCAPGAAPSPAVSAGIQPGDTIRSIDGVPVDTFDDAAAVIQASPGRTLSVVLDRGGVSRTVALTPAALDRDGATRGYAGITPVVDYVRQPVWAGATTAFQNVGAVVGVVARLPVLLADTAASIFTGAERDPNGPLSLVGAGAYAGEIAAAESPIVNRVSGMLLLLGSLNIALFVFNLIPLLPLDGGHIVVALWDGAKRLWARVLRRPPPKPVDATKLVPITFLVVILLVAMGAILIVADIVNPIDLFR